MLSFAALEYLQKLFIKMESIFKTTPTVLTARYLYPSVIVDTNEGRKNSKLRQNHTIRERQLRHLN
jgi:hypothetical protein